VRSIELVGLRGQDFGVLYVYGPGKSDVSQFFNRLEFLREYARTKFPEAEIHETLLDGFWEITTDNTDSADRRRRESGTQESRNNFEHDLPRFPVTARATV
jgi:hypothetical protein